MRPSTTFSLFFTLFLSSVANATFLFGHVPFKAQLEKQANANIQVQSQVGVSSRVVGGIDMSVIGRIGKDIKTKDQLLKELLGGDYEKCYQKCVNVPSTLPSTPVPGPGPGPQPSTLPVEGEDCEPEDKTGSEQESECVDECESACTSGSESECESGPENGIKPGPGSGNVGVSIATSNPNPNPKSSPTSDKIESTTKPTENNSKPTSGNVGVSVQTSEIKSENNHVTSLTASATTPAMPSHDGSNSGINSGSNSGAGNGASHTGGVSGGSSGEASAEVSFEKTLSIFGQLKALLSMSGGFNVQVFVSKAASLHAQFKPIFSLLGHLSFSKKISVQLNFVNYFFESMFKICDGLTFWKQHADPCAVFIYKMFELKMQAMAMFDSCGQLDVSIENHQQKLSGLLNQKLEIEKSFSEKKSVAVEADFNTISNEVGDCIQLLQKQIGG